MTRLVQQFVYFPDEENNVKDMIVDCETIPSVEPIDSK
jgi:hypothetical protein